MEWSKRLDIRFIGPVLPADVPTPDLGRQVDESRPAYLRRLYVYAATHSRGMYAPRLFVFGHMVPGALLGAVLGYVAYLAGMPASGIGQGAVIGVMLGAATGSVIIVWGLRQHRE